MRAFSLCVYEGLLLSPSAALCCMRAITTAITLSRKIKGAISPDPFLLAFPRVEKGGGAIRAAGTRCPRGRQSRHRGRVSRRGVRVEAGAGEGGA